MHGRLSAKEQQQSSATSPETRSRAGLSRVPPAPVFQRTTPHFLEVVSQQIWCNDRIFWTGSERAIHPCSHCTIFVSGTCSTQRSKLCRLSEWILPLLVIRDRLSYLLTLANFVRCMVAGLTGLYCRALLATSSLPRASRGHDFPTVPNSGWLLL